VSFFYININDESRQQWLKEKLSHIPRGLKVLDAGAGELRNRPLCSHLSYVSQDFGQYEGVGDGKGLQTGSWNTSCVDLVCDITSIPEPNAAFDAILCTEVLEHVPEPTRALDEFSRLLKPGGRLILTAPFASIVHFAPYHYCSGFSRYWYEYQFPQRGFRIEERVSNGDWFGFLKQEMMRLGSTARRYGDRSWPLAYLLALIGLVYFKVRGGRTAEDLACFGWQCVAVKI
jgi:SAM-dependent methyltransferase